MTAESKKIKKNQDTEIDREQLPDPPSSTGGEEIPKNWEKMKNDDNWRKFQHFSTILVTGLFFFFFG